MTWPTWLPFFGFRDIHFSVHDAAGLGLKPGTWSCLVFVWFDVTLCFHSSAPAVWDARR